MLITAAFLLPALASAAPMSALVARDGTTNQYIPDWIGGGSGQSLCSISILSSGWIGSGALVTGAVNQKIQESEGGIELVGGSSFADWDLGRKDRYWRMCTFVFSQSGDLQPEPVRRRRNFNLNRFLWSNGINWWDIRGLECWSVNDVHDPETPQPEPSTSAPPLPESTEPSASTSPSIPESSTAPATTATPLPESTSAATQPESTSAPTQPETTSAPTQPESTSAAPQSETSIADSTAVVVPPTTTVVVPSSSAPTSVLPETTAANETSTTTAANETSTTTAANETSTLPPTGTAPVEIPIETVTFGGKEYVNKGLVGFGSISAETTDFFHDKIGSIGAMHLVSLNKEGGGGFTGQFIVQPDRGEGKEVVYHQRYTYVDFKFNPYYGAGNLDFANAKATLGNMTSPWSVKYKEFGSRFITGADARYAGNASNPVPHPTPQNPRQLSADAEGFVFNKDTTFWVAEEYAPSILKFSREGVLLNRYPAPAAFTPREGDQVIFSMDGGNPTKGRAVDRGFAGLTVSPDGKTLYALLESALIQDCVAADVAGRYTRMLAYDISTGFPTLKNAYVIELPVGADGNTLLAGEFHCIADDTFVLVAGDSYGATSGNTESKAKNFYLFSTAGATDIATTNYIITYDAVAPNNVLNGDVKAATLTPWIDIIDPTELARFSLHNGGAANSQLISAHWNSMAFGSCQDEVNPNDYFLFSFANNRFDTSVENQALVWRVTLPTKL